MTRPATPSPSAEAWARLTDPAYPLPPDGACLGCWYMKGVQVPAPPFVWGYPSTSPGEGPPVYYCPSCQERHEEQGVVLIPCDVAERLVRRILDGAR